MIICLFVIFLSVLDIKCPIYYVSGIRCPTCGVTRAMISLFSLDFNSYISYHPLALELSASVWLMLHIKLFKEKKYIYFFVLVTLFFNTLLYLNYLL